MKDPAFILIEPQMGENIGAAARGMWNFGLRHMRITSPRDGWPNPKAVAMASGAGSLLDEAMVVGTTADAVGDLNYLYATTARPREMTKTVFTPEGAARDMARRIGAGERVGVLFGPERAGLANEDVVRANAIITVPVNPKFPSLNLAQCVLLMSYEWRRQAAETPDKAYQTGKSELATAEAVDRLIDHLVEELDGAGFFFPETKRASMITNLANLYRRTPLTDQDVRTMWGVIRALAQKRLNS